MSRSEMRDPSPSRTVPPDYYDRKRKPWDGLDDRYPTKRPVDFRDDVLAAQADKRPDWQTRTRHTVDHFRRADKRDRIPLTPKRLWHVTKAGESRRNIS